MNEKDRNMLFKAIDDVREARQSLSALLSAVNGAFNGPPTTALRKTALGTSYQKLVEVEEKLYKYVARESGVK